MHTFCLFVFVFWLSWQLTLETVQIQTLRIQMKITLLICEQFSKFLLQAICKQSFVLNNKLGQGAPRNDCLQREKIALPCDQFPFISQNTTKKYKIPNPWATSLLKFMSRECRLFLYQTLFQLLTAEIN